MPPALIRSLPFAWALLFWASYHPLDWGFLGWIQLVPLLLYAKHAKGWKAGLLAWLGGALGHGAGLFWVRFTVPPGPYFLGAIFGLYVLVFCVVIRRIGPLWAPAVWTALEFLRGHLFSGMPWLLLGYTQHDSFRVIQIADLGGVWLVTALVAFVSGALVDGRRAARWTAAGLVIASYLYGVIRLPMIELKEGPAIRVVQPNIPQEVKMISRGHELQAIENFEKHLGPTREAAGRKADLVVWPEAVLYEGVVWDAGAGRWAPTFWNKRIVEAGKLAEAPLLLGALIWDRGAGPPQISNSALLVDPAKGVVARFDKVHRVPYAEYVLLGDVFPVIRTAIRHFMGWEMVDMRPGKEFPVWEAGGVKYGPQICFEAIFPEISREVAGKGARFAVNISNDGWFRDSAELDQMQVMSRFRAIENRIGFVRATNTGISAFIAPTGREDAVLEVGGRRKAVGGVLEARVAWTESGSLYRVLGDWVAWAAAGAALAAWAGRILVDRQKRRK